MNILAQIEGLKALRAIGVHEYEEDEHGIRVVFDDRLPAADAPPKREAKPHGKQALYALNGIPKLDPNHVDPAGAA